MRATVRFVGAVDVVTGALALMGASWLGDQVGVSTMAASIAGVALLLLGVDNVLLAGRPVMAKINLAIEALVGLAAIDIAVLGDTTGTGVAMLLVCAAYCAAVSIRLAAVQRTPNLVAT